MVVAIAESGERWTARAEGDYAAAYRPAELRGIWQIADLFNAAASRLPATPAGRPHAAQRGMA